MKPSSWRWYANVSYCSTCALIYPKMPDGSRCSECGQVLRLMTEKLSDEQLEIITGSREILEAKYLEASNKVRLLEAERDKLKKQKDNHLIELSLSSENLLLKGENDKLKSRLAEAEKLPEKWRNYDPWGI